MPEVGEVYDAVVKSIMPYGCFIEFMPGKEGLLHISEIDWRRYETMEETGLQEGDHITVKLLEIDDKTGKFKLSARALKEKPEGYVEPERRPRPERGERRDQNRHEGHENHEHRAYPRHDERFGHETRRPNDPEADGARLRR